MIGDFPVRVRNEFTVFFLLLITPTAVVRF